MYPDLPPSAPLPREGDEISPARRVLALLVRLPRRTQLGIAAGVLAALIGLVLLLGAVTGGGGSDPDASPSLPPAPTAPLLPAPPVPPGADQDDEASAPFAVDPQQFLRAENAALQGTPVIVSVLFGETEVERLQRIAPYVTARSAERFVKVPPVEVDEDEAVTALLVSGAVIRADTVSASFRVTLELTRTIRGSAAPSTTEIVDLRVEVLLAADRSWRVDRITLAAPAAGAPAPPGEPGAD